MTQSVTIELPEETARRYQYGARVAHKRLEEFLVERLADAAPPLADELPEPLREELKQLESLNDDALGQVARSPLPVAKQRRYTQLLERSERGEINIEEAAILKQLGDEARKLTLKRAHAYMLLKWRGHTIPALEQLEEWQEPE